MSATIAAMQFEVLGPLEVIGPSGVVKIGSGLQRAILAILATLSARRRRETWTAIAWCALGGGSLPQTSSMRLSVETVSPT
jgi:hypothetical protein